MRAKTLLHWQHVIIGPTNAAGFAHKASLGETTVDVNISIKSMLHALSLASSKGWYDHYDFPAADYNPGNKWGFTQVSSKITCDAALNGVSRRLVPR